MAYVTWTSKFGTTTATTDVLITGNDEVEITGNVTVRHIDITSGGKLRLAPGASIALDCYGNIHAQGAGSVFISRPAVGAIHNVVFRAVDEEAFVGTSNDTDHSFQVTDRGLWIQHGAQIDVGDSRDRLPWTNLAGGANAGDNTITLKEAPANWQIGDRLVITPTVSPQTHPTNYWAAYDEPTITGISGNTITLSAPLVFPHPAVQADSRVIPAGWTQPTTWTAEVLNLTRDMKIQGTPSGRAHVMIHSNGVMYIKNVEIRYMGPQKKVKADGSIMTGVSGRYSLHFHHGGYNVGWPTVKSTYENIAVSQSGFRSYVTHNSHGITLTRCIGHDGQGPMFWWDPNGAAGNSFTHNQTLDLTWDRCVGSKVREMTGQRQYRLEVFAHPDGQNMTTKDCVAVGEASRGSSAGFSWGEGANEVWHHNRNTAHNCKTNGLFVWQNNNEPHLVDDFTAYHCSIGIDHGAYRNGYQYTRALLVGCTVTGLKLHASSSMTEQKFVNFGIDGKGFGKHAMIFAHPNLSPNIETKINDWKVANLAPANPANGDGHGIKVITGVGDQPNLAYVRNWEFYDSGFTDDHLIWWDSIYVAGDILKVRNPMIGGVDQGMFDVMHPSNPAGIAVPEWNNAKRLMMAVDDLGPGFDGTYELMIDKFATDYASGWGPDWTVTPRGTGSSASVASEVGIMTAGVVSGSGVYAFPSNTTLLAPDEDGQIVAIIDFTPLQGTTGIFTPMIGLRATYTLATNVATGYWLTMRPSGSTYDLYRRNTDGTSVSLGSLPSPTGAPRTNGGIHYAKLRIETPVIDGVAQETRIRARAWEKGNPEPSLWGIDIPLDASPLVDGQPGVCLSRSSGTTPTHINWEEVKISNFVKPTNPDALMLVATPQSLSFTSTSAVLPLSIGTSDDDAASVEVIAKPDWVTLSDPVSFTAPGTITITVDTASMPAGSTTGQLFFSSETHGSLQVILTYTGAPVAQTRARWWQKTESGLVQATVHIKL